MIYLKTPDEIQLVKAAADLTSRTLGEVARWIEPGVTTRKLDTIAREFIQDNGGRPACLGYEGFPGTLCIVVELNGFMGDSCYTFPVGEVDPKVLDLCRTTKESLYEGIRAAKAGKRVGDIANAVQTYCEHRGYSVVREMCGHGIGKNMHEDPEVPNYGRRGIGPVLRNGMCICIEPMINMGSRNITIDRDGWTCRTRDHKPTAHYEHTLAIADDEPLVLTTFDYIKEVLQDRFI